MLTTATNSKPAPIAYAIVCMSLMFISVMLFMNKEYHHVVIESTEIWLFIKQSGLRISVDMDVLSGSITCAF